MAEPRCCIESKFKKGDLVLRIGLIKYTVEKVGWVGKPPVVKYVLRTHGDPASKSKLLEIVGDSDLELIATKHTLQQQQH